MPTKQIVPPISVWGGFSTGSAEQVLLECFNNSGGTLAHGDVVVVDNSAGQMPTAPGSITGAVTTTTTASDPKVLGVVSIDGTANTNAATVAAGATCFVAIAGCARVQIGANTVAAGGNLSTTTTVKQAGTAAAAASVGALQALVGTFFAVALEAQTAKDANNTIRCILKSG